MTAPQPLFKLTYLGRDITPDVESYLIDVSYTDKVHGEADEIQITLHDSDDLWKGAWYPSKKDLLRLEIGYVGGEMLDCGAFEIDEIEVSGAPDTVTIRGLAAGISGQLRTKKSTAHEQVLLRQIADAIAAANGLTVVDGTARNVHRQASFEAERTILDALATEVLATEGENVLAYRVIMAGITVRLTTVIASLRTKSKTRDAVDLEEINKSLQSSTQYDRWIKHVSRKFSEVSASLKDYSFDQTVSKLDGVMIDRVTQNQETDLAFLTRIAAQHGLIFSVKGEQLIFMAQADIEKAAGVLTLHRSDLMSFSYRDKSFQTYRKARVAYHDPNTAAVVESSIMATDETNLEYDADGAEDDLEVRSRATDGAGAETQAKAALHSKNADTKTISITTTGKILLVAGNNFIQTGIGKASGRYSITQSTHAMSRGGGYTTSVDARKIADVAENLQQR